MNVTGIKPATITSVNSDDRSADFMHDFLRGLIRAEVSGVHLLVDGLHDNDGIVHDNTDREHEREQGDQVNRHAKHEHEEERTNQRQPGQRALE